MTTKIYVTHQDPDGRGRVYPFWREFLESFDAPDIFPARAWGLVLTELENYNARFRRDISNEQYIEFETEEDATMFALKYCAR